MNIKIELKDLKKIYSLIKGDIHIIAAAGEIKVGGYIDKDGLIIAGVIKGEIIEEGDLLLQNNIIKSIKEKNALLEINNENLKINNRNINYKYIEGRNYFKDLGDKIATLNLEDYNKILTLEHAIAKDATRPVLQCIYIDEKNAVAIDGYRLGTRKHQIQFNKEFKDPNFLIPKEIIKMMKKVKPAEKSIIEFYVTNFETTLKVDNLYIIGYRPQGTYINYSGLIPSTGAIQTEIKINQVLEILKSYDKTIKSVKIDIKQDAATLTAKNEFSTFTDEIEVNSNKEFSIRVNPLYLKDSLKVLKGDKVKLIMNANVEPIIIKEKDILEMVLPLRSY